MTMLGVPGARGGFLVERRVEGFAVVVEAVASDDVLSVGDAGLD